MNSKFQILYPAKTKSNTKKPQTEKYIPISIYLSISFKHKGNQYHQSLGKRKSKPQWDNHFMTTEMAIIKKKKKIINGKDVEKLLNGEAVENMAVPPKN